VWQGEDPIYFLYSHALELTLKAFLRAKGYSAERLRRKCGHKLGARWQECLNAGLSTELNNDAFMEAVIEILDPLATAYEFPISEVGPSQVPQSDELELAIGRLRAAVEPIVRSASPIQGSRSGV
jgi:hypothetical protein